MKTTHTASARRSHISVLISIPGSLTCSDKFKCSYNASEDNAIQCNDNVNLMCVCMCVPCVCACVCVCACMPCVCVCVHVCHVCV